MSRSHTRIAQLITRIYASIRNASATQEFVDGLVDLTKSKSGLLVLQNTSTLAIDHTIQNGFEPAARGTYDDNFRLHDNWMINICKLPKGNVYTNYELLPQNEFRKSLIYTDFCRPLDIEYCLGVLIPTREKWCIRLGLQRGKQQSEFESEQIRALNYLLPHLLQAYQIKCQLDEATLVCKGLADLHLREGKATLTYSAEGEILHDTGVEEMLSRADSGFRIRHGQVKFDSERHASRYAAMLGNALANKKHQSGSISDAMSVHNLSNPHQILRIAVTAVHTQESGTCEPCAIAIFSLDDCSSIDPGLIRKLYQLTPSEAETVRLLALGFSINDARQHLDISENTIRGYIKSAMHKCNVRRHGDLVRLVLTGPTRAASNISQKQDHD